MIPALAFLGLVALAGCGDDGVTGPGDCDSKPTTGVGFQGEMRKLVQDVSGYARGVRPDFIVVPHEGLPLVTADGKPTGDLVTGYLAALTGIGQGGVFFGLDEDNLPSDPARNDQLVSFLDRLLAAGKPVLATSYCRDRSLIAEACSLAGNRGFLSFTADSRALDTIPSYPATPVEAHAGDVDHLTKARNYLYLAESKNFADRQVYLAEIAATNYDILIVDPFPGGSILIPDEVEGLGAKKNGGRRLVLASVSIGRAEADLDYWQDTWNAEMPVWVDRSQPGNPGVFEVYYWNPAWRSIIMGSPEAVLDRIVAAGFDGVYLGGVDAYESFASRFG